MSIGTVRLLPFAFTSNASVRHINVLAKRTGSGGLEFRYEVEGDIEQLLIPDAGPATRTDKLWQHTCFEAFVGAPEETGYYELNLSPSGQWAVYRFADYRSGMQAADVSRPPGISVQRTPDRLMLHAQIDLSLRDNTPLRVGLAAVVEEVDRSLSYWALAHPAPKADFHHSAGFTLMLPGHS